MDFYRNVRQAEELLFEAISNQEGHCRIAYWESIVAERQREAEAAELNYLQGKTKTINTREDMKMDSLIRIDRANGQREPESAERVRRLIADHYPLDVRDKVWNDLIIGERQFATEFAIYELDGFVPFTKRI